MRTWRPRGYGGTPSPPLPFVGIAPPPASQVVVATSLPKLLGAARAAFAAEGLTALVLEGSPSERAAAAAAFVSSSASGVKALLLNAAADCAGLTLTVANHLFVLEPIPSPPVFAQLCARICRMGQTKVRPTR